MGKSQISWGRIALHIVEVALLHLVCCLPILERLMVNNNAYDAIVHFGSAGRKNTNKHTKKNYLLGIPNFKYNASSVSALLSTASMQVT